LARTKGLCEVCEAEGRVVHEKWEYDDTNRVQKLTGFEVVCWNCSNAHHLGAASVLGYADEAIRHFMKVNALSQQRAQQLLHEAARVMIERSKRAWTQDFSWLKKNAGNYGFQEQDVCAAQE